MKNKSVNRIISDKAWRRIVSLLLALSVFMGSGIFYGLNVKADESEVSQAAPQMEEQGIGESDVTAMPEVTNSPESETTPEMTDATEPSVEPEAPDSSEAVETPDASGSDVSDIPGASEPVESETPEDKTDDTPDVTTAPSDNGTPGAVIPQGGLEHMHISNEIYMYNEFFHWHGCIFEGCDQMVDAYPHIWDDGVITVSASDFGNGVITRTCVVCQAISTEFYQLGDEICGYTEHIHNADCEAVIVSPTGELVSSGYYKCGMVEHEHVASCYATVTAGGVNRAPQKAAAQGGVPDGSWENFNCLFIVRNGIYERIDSNSQYSNPKTPYEITSGDTLTVFAKFYYINPELGAYQVISIGDNDYGQDKCLVPVTADFTDLENNQKAITRTFTASYASDTPCEVYIVKDNLNIDGEVASLFVKVVEENSNDNAPIEANKIYIKQADGSMETKQALSDNPDDANAGINPITVIAGSEIELISYVPDAYLYMANGTPAGGYWKSGGGEKFDLVSNNQWNGKYVSTTVKFNSDADGYASVGFTWITGYNGSNFAESWDWVHFNIVPSTFESNKIYVDKEGNGNYVYHNTTPDNPLMLEVGQTLAIMSNPKAGGDYSNNVDPTGASDPYIFIPSSNGSAPAGFPADYTENNYTYRFFYAAHAGETFFTVNDDIIYVKVNYVPQMLYVDKQDGTGYRIVEDNSSENPIILKVGESLNVLSRGASVTSTNEGILSGIATFAASDENTYTFTATSVGTTTLTTGNDTLYVKVINYEYNRIYYAIGNSEEYILASPNQEITVTKNDTVKLKIYLSQPSNEYGSNSDKKYFYRPNGNDSVLNNFDTTFSDGNRVAETTITAMDVGDSKVSYEIPPGRKNTSVNIHVTKGYASDAMYVDVVFGNSFYPDVEIGDATSMIRGSVNVIRKVHQGAEKNMGDLENAAGNSPSNRFIMYVGETTNVRLHDSFSGSNYFYTNDNVKINSNTYITLGNTQNDENGYRSCTVTALKPGLADIHADGSNAVFYVEVLYPIYVETSLGEKHMNYINEYVYTANDYWLPDNPQNTIFSPEGLPVFIKNYPGYLFGYYRLIEDQFVDLTTYTEVGNTDNFYVSEGPAHIESTIFDGVVEKDGKKYRKVTVRLRADWVNADTRGKVQFGDQVFDFMVYNIETDSYEGTGNHFDIERSDGGKYIITIENPDGTYTKYTYDVFVTDINGCNVYNKNGELIAELSAGEYYERGQPEDSSQFELTSAYITDGNGNLPNNVPVAKQRKWIKVSDIGEVIFDLQLELKNPQVEVVDANGNIIPNRQPETIDELMNLDYLASVSVDMGYREIIDAYNKCPNHFGLDFTLKKEIFATRQSVEVNKRLTGAELEERQFEFEVFRNNPYKPFWDGENWVYPTPTAWAYNDADGLLHFYTYDDVVDDFGGVTQQYRSISMLAFTDPGRYYFYIREIIPTTPDGIIYDTRLIRITVYVEELASGLLKVVGTPEYHYSTDQGNNWILFTSSAIPGFTNTVPMPLPATGGEGTNRYLTFGIVLLFSGFLLLFLDRRRRGSRSANSAAEMR